MNRACCWLLRFQGQILLTPDEIAYLECEDSLPDHERKKEKRARPNVIFEFGYFVGKLGRNRVCCLYTGNVTLPSDLSGFVYKKYNDSIEEVAYGIQKDLKSIKVISSCDNKTEIAFDE